MPYVGPEEATHASGISRVSPYHAAVWGVLGFRTISTAGSSDESSSIGREPGCIGVLGSPKHRVGLALGVKLAWNILIHVEV